MGKGGGKGSPIGAPADKGGFSKGGGKGYSDWDDGKAQGKAGGKAKAAKAPVSEPPMKRPRPSYNEAPMDGPAAACQDPLVLQSESTIAFYIPSDCIGKVLGKAGSIANEIRSASG